MADGEAAGMPPTSEPSWVEALARALDLRTRRKLSACAYEVLSVLLMRFRNHKTGLCCPSVPALAEATGYTERRVYSARAELASAEVALLAWTPDGRGVAYTFWPNVPTPDASVTPDADFMNPASPLTPTSQTPDASVNPPKPPIRSNQIQEPEEEEERARATLPPANGEAPADRFFRLAAQSGFSHLGTDTMRYGRGGFETGEVIRPFGELLRMADVETLAEGFALLAKRQHPPINPRNWVRELTKFACSRVNGSASAKSAGLAADVHRATTGYRDIDWEADAKEGF